MTHFDAEPSRFRYEPQSMQEAMLFSEAVVQSGLVPHVKRKEAAFAIIVTGAELGLTAMQSLRSIHIVDGKPTLSADLIVGLVKRSSVCQWFRLVETTNERAVFETLRRGEPEPTRYVYTMEDAARANLLGRRPWRQYTAAMLRARCATALARAVYPDLVAGIYEPDELQHHHSELLPNAVGHGLLLDDAEEAQVVAASAQPAPTPPSDFVEHASPSMEHVSEAYAHAAEASTEPEPQPEEVPAEALEHAPEHVPEPMPEPTPEPAPRVDVTAKMRELVELLRAQGGLKEAATFAGGRIAAHHGEKYATPAAAVAALRETFTTLKKQSDSQDQMEILARAWLLLDANAP
jgi:hypothetical protein